MSDQEQKPDDDSSERTESAPAAPPASPTPAPAPAEPRKASSLVAWLALLLVLCLGGAAAWYLPQLQRSGEALNSRIAEIESEVEASVGGERASMDAVSRELNDELQAGLGELRAEIDQAESAVESSEQRLSRAMLELESQLADQRAEVARFGANDRTSWLLAEAEYLLRLASQRLVMAGDAVAARALITSADGVLREIDDAGLFDARAALAADLAAVRAVPTIDVEGIYLRLSALIEQADALVIFSLREREAEVEPEAASGWQERLRQGYSAALEKLSDYIIIRRRDVPMQALMDPQWEGLVRQNLRMLLEQAQVAVLSENAVLYRESLERARDWVAQFDESDPARASAMTREINQLASARVAVDMPDLSRSLRALDEAVEQHLDRKQQGGDE